ncbi:hypothetical protein Airi01_087510 [Actinoallomurus iriomotensis]|uniref:Uncharacterized protein n=1 Tax=Actinoallomurus iriomotensis TaxID=478107 RepID=A0A9W6VUT1_9ACTN|nr:hypothetical protein Airi01_087510 [Actinoallomurus iriomotensis]
MRDIRDPRENVTGPQAYGDPVRVVKNDRVIDPQAERVGRGNGSGHPSRDI